MREPPRDKGRLLHIQEAIKTILERAQGQTFESLTKDKIVYGGIVYYTMIIGEAAYKLSRDFVATYNQVDWDVIANMRHHLVHGYYQVNAKDVWDVIQSDLKPLQDQVTQLLESIDWEEWENNKPTI
ncbi:MAG: DUF86 domain-containing protein [Bacteroidaceae bacterium]|nr:DUF86 domain-containing protein [Bacteroidaceae bacterium]